MEASIKEKRRFTLARDPHQCAFGKWYDNFKTDNILLSAFLKRFDAPHKKIHSLADEVDKLIANGCTEQASERFAQTRTGVLATMLGLFADFQQMIRDTHREIAVVLHGQAGAYAISVDSVASVERLAPADMETLAGKGLEQQNDLVNSVAKRGKGGLVLILAIDSILDPAQHAKILRDGEGANLPKD